MLEELYHNIEVLPIETSYNSIYFKIIISQYRIPVNRRNREFYRIILWKFGQYCKVSVRSWWYFFLYCAGVFGLSADKVVKELFEPAFVFLGEESVFFDEIILVPWEGGAGAAAEGVRPSGYIIKADIVEIRKGYGKIERHGMFSLFIVRVCCFVHE